MGIDNDNELVLVSTIDNNINDNNVVQIIDIDNKTINNPAETNTSTLQKEQQNATISIIKKNNSSNNKHFLFHKSKIFFYINFSIYSILGFILRYYLNELFHSGCTNENEIFSTTHYHLLCVTSSNTSLFLDLPANLLGCFIIGFMATSSKIITKNDNDTDTDNQQKRTIPWIHSKHYFQKRPMVHLAIRTGFCGCLTTFASWNAQMVQMI